MSQKRLFLAAPLFLFTVINTAAPALEIKVREVIRGAFVPLSADTDVAKEEAKAAAKKSHEEKCAAWTDAAKQLGANAIYVSCGAREDNYKNVGKAIVVKMPEGGYETLAIRGYQSMSEGLLMIEAGKNADLLHQSFSGEAATLKSTEFLKNVGFKGAATAVVAANQSYDAACLAWKEAAKSIGAKFIYASCEHPDRPREDALGAYSADLKLTARGSIYFQIDAAVTVVPHPSINNETLIPLAELPTGRYNSNGGYLMNVKVSQWAASQLFEGQVSYGGNRSGFDILLSRSTVPGQENQFSGQGTIRQKWETGDTCTYPISVEIFAYKDQELRKLFYARDYSPESLYTTWPISTQGCPPAGGPYSWRMNKKPYYFAN